MLMNQRMNTQRVAGFLVALLVALAVVSCSGSGAGVGPVIRMQLSHTDADRGLAPRELLQRMALRSKTHAARFLSGSSSSSTVSAVPGKGQPFADECLVSFAIGKPPQPVKMTLDTGSDLIWTQCQPCIACYHHALPYFDMSNSSTIVPFPCNSSTCGQLPWPSCSGTTTTQVWGNQTCALRKKRF
ncbi:aspartic proteinase nepenthesin-1-like [Miscanthus floridulus]|uniref:aspartic proteinase nepenthesin-1-like n=1 Tax=Miscanthus floridulus TaxID=154761 RepID=UPI0034592FE1